MTNISIANYDIADNISNITHNAMPYAIYNSLDTPEIHLAHRLFGNYPFCVLQIKRNVSLVKLSWLITPTSKRSPPAPDYNYHHHALNQLSSLPGSPRVPVISPLPTQISAMSQTVNCNIIQF